VNEYDVPDDADPADVPDAGGELMDEPDPAFDDVDDDTERPLADEEDPDDDADPAEVDAELESSETVGPVTSKADREAQQQ